MQVDVIVKGDEQARRLTQKLSRRLVDGTPRFKALVDQILEAEQDRFRGRGARWRKLSRTTIREHEHRGRDARPLILTGVLERSLTRRGARGQVLRITPTTLTFGTSIFYARFHQKGEGVPRRTVVGLTRVQRKQVVGELRQLLLEDL